MRLPIKASNFAVVAAVALAISIFSGCVPARQVEELKAKYEKCETERAAFNAEKADLETQVNELNRKIEEDARRLIQLEKDTAVTGTSLRKMTRQYDKINRLNDELLSKIADLNDRTEAENAKLQADLQESMRELQRREDAVRALERELESKATELEDLERQLAKREARSRELEAELEKREARVKELEALLAQKDQKVKDLKQSLSDALLNFEGKGLTVEQRDGKIYVSMEAKLLFAKGSTKVGTEGVQVLTDLAKALQDQEDIEVLVEGHTDTDPLSGTGTLKDNWDLSVMRATSVVRIMLQNSSMDPGKVTAAGRSEFKPVDPADSEEAKAKNRRIEVILTPNLDELFDIIEAE